MITLEPFEALLKRTMGLDAASIGSGAIERAVQVRMTASQQPDLDRYWALVRASDAELQDLIEAVVVPETWFFRDAAAFAALAQIAREEWRPAHAHGILRLLSVPCSTGEEAYSMAIALREALIPQNRVRIDALDISVHALKRAAEAVYTRNSFRGDDLGFRDRHFDATPQGWRLNESMRKVVRFAQGNLLAPAFLPGTDGYAYDVIFCRNLLIYFDRPTQERALEALTQLLAPHGVLFVGPAESGLILNAGFVPVPMSRAFAFRKPEPKVEPVRLAPLAVAAPPPVATARRSKRRIPAPSPLRAAPFVTDSTPGASEAVVPAPSLEQARALADAGRLAEALEICRASLRANGPSAQAYYLLGVISDASSQVAEAADAYNRAIYLDPRQKDAMLHLAALLDRAGDARGAQAMRDRARRVEGNT